MEYLDSIAYRSNLIAKGRVVSLSSDSEKHYIGFRIQELFLTDEHSRGLETLELSMGRPDDNDLGGLGTVEELPPFSNFREGADWFLFLARLPDEDGNILTWPVCVMEAGAAITGFKSTPHGLLRDFENDVSQEAFRAALDDALRVIKETRALNARKPATRELADAYRAVLRRRAAMYADQEPGRAYEDFIAHGYCVGAARLHEPELLDELLNLTLPETDLFLLRLGFGTPDGREFLLRRVNDAELALEKRRRYVFAIEEAHGDYYAVTEIHDNGNNSYHYSTEGDNGRYLKRLAAAAVAPGTPADLRADLIGAVRKLLEPLLSRFSTPDIEDAVHVIRDASTGFADPRSRYETLLLDHQDHKADTYPLSTLTHGGPDPWPFSLQEYTDIMCKAGEKAHFALEAHDFATYPMEPAPPGESRAPGELLSQSEIDALLPMMEGNPELVVLHVLEHQASDATFEIQQEEPLFIEYCKDLKQWSSFRIPAHAPPGEYRHELRVLDEDGMVLNQSFAYSLFVNE